jgi:hypothetical protein
MKMIHIILAALFLLTSVLATKDAIGIEDTTIEDEAGDVISSETVERIVSGYGEIDIVSLVSVQDLTTVTVTLTTVDSMETGDEYSYDITVGDIYASYSDGELEIDTFSSTTSTTGEVIENELILEIPRSELNATWFYISARTYFFDWESFENTATYTDDIDYDPFVDFTRAPDTFNRDLTDETGDVMETTDIETPVSDRPELDILAISLINSGSDEITLEMEMAGQVTDDDRITYTIYLDDAYIEYSAGDGYINYHDGGSSTTVSASGTKIIAVLDETRISSTDYINADAEYFDWEEGINIYDDAGTSGWGDIDLEGLFDMEMSIAMKFEDIDEIEIRFTISIGEGNYSRMMRTEMDSDEDGTITEEEIESQIEDDAMMDPIDSDMISMDGISPRVASDLEYSGLTGPADSKDPLTITMITILSFDLEDRDNHTFRIGPDSQTSYENTRSGEIQSAEETVSSFFPVSFEISLPSGWTVDPDSVKPSGLTDHIEDGRIKMDAEELEDIGLGDSEEMSITFIKDDDGKDPEKLPFGSAIPIMAFLLLAAAMAIIHARKR